MSTEQPPAPREQGPQQQDPQQQEPVEQEPPRPFPGLRVAAYFLTVMLALSLALSVLLVLAVGPDALPELAAADDPSDELDPILLFWLQVLSVPVALFTTLAFVRLFDRRPIADLGLKRPQRPVLQTSVTILAAAATLGVWWLLVQPWTTWRLDSWSSSELSDLAPWMPLDAGRATLFAVGFLLAAFLEELVFRGYIFTAFSERMAWIHAAGLSTLLYIAFHAGRPDLAAPGLANIFVFGMVLAALRQATGSLWAGVLAQATWNVLLGCVLSQPIAGMYFPRFFDLEVSGPIEVTGGTYGPEGSWLLTGLLVAQLVALSWWLDRRSSPSTESPA